MKAPLDLFYSIDIICHRAASPLLFKEYIETLHKKHSTTIENFEFRDKTLRGWDEYVESYTANGKNILLVLGVKFITQIYVIVLHVMSVLFAR